MSSEAACNSVVNYIRLVHTAGLLISRRTLRLASERIVVMINWTYVLIVGALLTVSHTQTHVLDLTVSKPKAEGQAVETGCSSSESGMREVRLPLEVSLRLNRQGGDDPAASVRLHTSPLLGNPNTYAAIVCRARLRQVTELSTPWKPS
jgi:hypothetical protein